MPGPARYTALLDACVLFPVCVADALMSVSYAGLYAAKWTRAIEDEWTRNLEKKLNKPSGTFDQRRDAMREAVADWEVPPEAWERLAGCLSLPDQDDVHVLAAAIAGHADCIVTSNLKHFPESALAPFGLQAIHPDDFLIAQWDLDPVALIAAMKEQRQRLRSPAMTPEAFADAFERNGLTQIALRLRQVAKLI